MTKCLLFTEKLFVFKYCLYLLFKGQTPLHTAAEEGRTEVVDLLLKEGASLTAEDYEVIKPSVKLWQSNIKLLKWHII